MKPWFRVRATSSTQTFGTLRVIAVEHFINQLYTVFGKYAKPSDFVACECCLSADEKNTLLTTPLRELTDGQLSEYAADAFHTVGEVPDFKYFLPRIFELAVRDEFRWPSPEVITSKLSLAHWLDWPEEEQVAVSDLLQAKFETLVNDSNSVGSDIDQWICALGRCLRDPTPFLKPLLQPQHEDKLLAFIACNGSLFTKNKLDSAFWEDAPENEKRVITWLNQPAVKAVLSERYGMVFQGQ